ncbi:MAG: 16S rRNA (uracil(1498)-N(3))-methyltransferase [Victivallales bacterium]|nr:16S rRNA (uracil(1498)-N(3))-methyltransferase [Victivallales bacterium]
MQLRRFYTPELSAGADTASLSEGESQHALRVLRMQPGDELLLLNGRGLIAHAELLPPLEGVRRPRQAICHILEKQEYQRIEPSLELCVAPPRGKAFDAVLRAATELGFATIQPVLCRYGVARPDDVADGWQETLVAALKQSCNPWLPEVRVPRDFSEVLADGVCGVFGASPAAEATPHRALSVAVAKTVRRVWVGPEGGFAPEEENALLAKGVIPVTIGSATLRVETAVSALAGFLLGRCEGAEGDS